MLLIKFHVIIYINVIITQYDSMIYDITIHDINIHDITIPDNINYYYYLKNQE